MHHGTASEDVTHEEYARMHLLLLEGNHIQWRSALNKGHFGAGHVVFSRDAIHLLRGSKCNSPMGIVL